MLAIDWPPSMTLTNKIRKAIGALPPLLAKRKSLNDNRGGTVPKRRRIISCINNFVSKFLPQPNILHLTLARLGIRDDFRTIHEAAVNSITEEINNGSEAVAEANIIEDINSGSGAFEFGTPPSLLYQNSGSGAFGKPGFLTINDENNNADAEVFEYGEGCAVFYNDVTSVRFHPSVVEVENHAFSYCKQLREVVLNEGLHKIGDSAFYHCASLSSVTLPSAVTEIGENAFGYCNNLREVIFNEGLQKIGETSFYMCTSLSSITLPSTVTEIGITAFGNCSILREVELNDGLKKIRAQAFCYCKVLSSIKLPSTVSEIGNGAFSDCNNLSEVVLNDGLRKIGGAAFSRCKSLSSITLPSTVTVGMQAILTCSNLREVVFHGIPREIGAWAFRNCTFLERFTFPTISARLDNLFQTGHWDEIENEVDEVRGVVERSHGELFVLSTRSLREGGNNWNRVRDDLDKIGRLISYYELKEATSIFELALWKFKLDQVDKANPIPRKKCRMDVPGPVKDIILQYLSYDCLLPLSDA